MMSAWTIPWLIPAMIEAVTTAVNEGILNALRMSPSIDLGEKRSSGPGCGRFFIWLWVPRAETQTPMTMIKKPAIANGG